LPVMVVRVMVSVPADCMKRPPPVPVLPEMVESCRVRDPAWTYRPPPRAMLLALKAVLLLMVDATIVREPLSWQIPPPPRSAELPERVSAVSVSVPELLMAPPRPEKPAVRLRSEMATVAPAPTLKIRVC
jgi:hypothetical protein